MSLCVILVTHGWCAGVDLAFQMAWGEKKRKKREKGVLVEMWWYLHYLIQKILFVQAPEVASPGAWKESERETAGKRGRWIVSGIFYKLSSASPFSSIPWEGSFCITSHNTSLTALPLKIAQIKAERERMPVNPQHPADGQSGWMCFSVSVCESNSYRPIYRLKDGRERKMYDREGGRDRA